LGVLVSDNAFWERDLGKNEALGQGVRITQENFIFDFFKGSGQIERFK
jgi:hypothetical protein